MAGPTVAGCVLTIIASLSRGVEVLENIHKSGASKKRRLRRAPDVPEEDTQLNTSLWRAMHSIDEEYQRCQSALGTDFATGDGSLLPFNAVFEHPLL